MARVKTLVTGSSGYIGSHLVRMLKDRGHHVIGTDRRPPATVRPDEFVPGDLLDPATVERALVGVEGVLHLAASKDDWGLSPAVYRRDNFEATRALLDSPAAGDVGRWLVYSTVGVMGPSAAPLDESAPFAPETPYGESKVMVERCVAAFADAHSQARVAMIRPSVVFGPGHPSNTNIHRLVEAIRRRRFLMIGDGDALKSTSYLPNLLAATEFLFERDEPGLRTSIYVDTPVISTRELVRRISSLLGVAVPRWRIPLGVARPIASVADAVGSRVHVDFPITAARIEKFCKPTNFDPSALLDSGFRPPFGLDEALEATVTWHLRRPGTRS